MAGTRQSARVAAQNNSSPQSATTTSGTKRKADASSPAAGNKGKKQQKTLEEVTPNENEHEDVQQTPAKETEEDNAGAGDVEMSEQKDATEGAAETTKTEEDSANGQEETKKESEKPNAFDKVQADEKDEGKTAAKTEESESTNGNAHESTSKAEASTDSHAVEEDKTREEAQPSNILEKGVIYFFTRGRVGTTDPDSVQDLQRSFFVMRPLPAGGKITDGAVQELKNLRLLALPKKVWPKSGKDRFMSFVEKAGTTMAELKESFMQGSEYSTKTTGTNHTPNVTLVGEGVYAMTRTGGGQGTTHLAYMLTVPSSPGEVQEDIGIKDKGSFVISLKNPESSGPANAQLPQGPGYPSEFIEEFGGRGWMPAEPKHIDYANAQILMIGESFDGSNNLEANPKDQKDDAKELPEEEIKKLESEDEQRIEHMKGDDTVFADLGVSKKDYGITTTW
ncbi:hypothetical protein WHR41_00611 [Cladosporium halotolerans]|uniref:BTB domain transcription factor n=1 Tax=Cladosporium halotolerans TaxID=1052096 RepID=A0AB34L3E7_9PEZI